MSFEIDYKTKEEWWEEDLYVIKGEYSHQCDAYGTPLYSEDQVTETEDES